MGLGGAITSSRIGGPLRVEIEILADDAERIDPSCLRLAAPPPGYNEELPWLSKGRISIEKQGNRRTLVVSNPSNNHPAIMLGVQISCGMEMRRDYTLLLNPPASEEVPLQPVRTAASTPQLVASPVSTRAERETSQVRTVRGDTARSIANRLYPDDIQAQRRMARALLSHNSELLNGQRGTYNSLPADLLLGIPPLPASLPEPATMPTVNPQADSPSASARPSTKSRTSPSPNKSRDRLIVSAGGANEALQMSTVIGQRKELNEDQRSRLRTELQLIATLDEKISTQLELADRLRQLEALQTRLKEDADRLEAELRAQQLQPPSASASQNPAPVSIAVATVSHPSQESTQDLSETAWHRNYTLLAGLGLGLVVLLGTGLWFWNRRADDRGADTLPLPDAELTGELGEHLIEPLSEADIWPDEEGHAPRTNTRLTASMEGALGVLTVSGLGPASMLQILDDDVEEHDSAVELADIMMSFGRVQGAAQTLADFIRANPKQAVKPWIKLLEVYRAADMRVEYEALTAQLNKTFNVRTVGWDEFEIARQAPESLESMPHIIKRLNETWGRRECQAFLHELLRDNRQGTRQGFPLAVIDEILLLLGILESQIGPFRPEANDLSPPTQTRSHSLNASTAALSIPPIITEAPTEPLNPVTPSQDKASTPSYSSSSISQLDFELDMSDLSKTLHLNLDELDSDNAKDDQPPR